MYKFGAQRGGLGQSKGECQSQGHGKEGPVGVCTVRRGQGEIPENNNVLRTGKVRGDGKRLWGGEAVEREAGEHSVKKLK